ncbi:MAG: Hsp20 family protein [Anaerolineaceae bacterium]
MTRLQQEFDQIIDQLMFPTRIAKTFSDANSGYPKYNLIRVSEEETVIELAVAGFKEDEIEVSVEENTLKISGRKGNTDVADYLYKGIATRAFEKSFGLTRDAKVTKAEYTDGILSVFVTYEIPEEKKPKAIPIGKGDRLYLTERSDIV